MSLLAIISTLTFIAGILASKVFEYAWPVIKEYLDRRREAHSFVSQSIDPILKAADELYGKLVSLSQEDFATFINPANSTSKDPDHSTKYVCYLFAQFWAQLEYIRIRSRYSSVTSVKKGEQLIRFIYTCETKKFRILDRSVQRIIGEAMIAGSNGEFKVMSLHDFMRKMKNEKSDFKKWISLLEDQLRSTNNKEIRQQILRYGIIAAALIEHFDPNHKIVLRRKIYTNKLNQSSRIFLKNELLGNHLPFVREPSKFFS